jgi:hypothetical protein
MNAQGVFGGNKCLLMVRTEREIFGTQVIADVPAIKRVKKVYGDKVVAVTDRDEEGNETTIPVVFNEGKEVEWRGSIVKGVYEVCSGSES